MGAQEKKRASAEDGRLQATGAEKATGLGVDLNQVSVESKYYGAARG